jgi:hypothetical protein
MYTPMTPRYIPQENKQKFFVAGYQKHVSRHQNLNMINLNDTPCVQKSVQILGFITC